MAALDGDDLTIVVTERWIDGVKRHARGTILIEGTGTYTTAGVTLAGVSPAVPAQKRFGMDRQLDLLVISGSQVDADPGTSSTTNYVYGYNPVTKALVIYEEEGTAAGGPLLEADTSEVPGPRLLSFYAIGW